MLPKDLKYSPEHMWLKINGDRVKVGVTDYAQKEFGDVVYVELPAIGEKVSPQNLMLTIESVKTVSEIHAPISGEVMEVNDTLEHSPELINQDPYQKGWIAIIEPSNPQELKDLLNAPAYTGLIGK